MTRVIRLLVVLAVVGAGMTAAISGVLAFEAQIVQVDARVSNAIGVSAPFTNAVLTGASAAFPEEFIQDSIEVGLSTDFETNTRFNTVNFGVVIQCADQRAGFFSGNEVSWMGDFTYLADSDPVITNPTFPLPGGGPAGPDPSLLVPNAPWKLIGGSPVAPWGCSSVSIPVFPAQVMKTAASGGPDTKRIYFGIDVPVCEASYNKITEDATLNQSGYNQPTVTLTGADPRNLVNCDFNGGMDLVIQVDSFTTT